MEPVTLNTTLIHCCNSGMSSTQSPHLAIDKASGASNPVKTVRSSMRVTEQTTSPTSMPVTHTDKLFQPHDPCVICGQTVSPKLQSVVCRLCGMCVHAKCDPTLTPTSIKLLNSESHPSVCYQCLKCRLAEPGKRNKLADRLTTLEMRFNQLQEQVNPSVSNLTNKTGLSTNDKSSGQILQIDPVKSPSNSPMSRECTSKWMSKSANDASQTKTVLVKSKQMPKSTTRMSYELSVICTNIKEPEATLLQDKNKHDREEWLKLCQRMQLQPIQPTSLIRLSRPPNSVHKDKPKLLRVTLKTEKELEEILLSAFLLQTGSENSERIFADTPYWERIQKPGHQGSINRSEDRNLIILGVPECNESADKNTQRTHDYQQWKFISETLSIEDVAVVDTFRIPKSPKYMGTGPRPLKLTLLRSTMVNIVKTRWECNRNLLPKELRIRLNIRNQASATKSSTVVEVPLTLSETSSTNCDHTPTHQATHSAKNDQRPTPQESATL